MINCGDSSWGCRCEGTDIRWQKPIVYYEIGDGFTAEQVQVMEEVINHTSSLLRCTTILPANDTSGVDIPISWGADEQDVLGVTGATYDSLDRMILAEIILNFGHYDGTYSTLYMNIDDFATVFWHELLHAMGVLDHAPQGSGNLMQANHNGPVTTLGAWDDEQIDLRYCDTVSTTFLTFKSTLRFSCAKENERMVLRLG